MTKKNTLSKAQEKRFDDLFACDCGQEKDPHYAFDMDGKTVKQHLANELAEEREKTLKKVEKVFEESDGDFDFVMFKLKTKHD